MSSGVDLSQLFFKPSLWLRCASDVYAELQNQLLEAEQRVGKPVAGAEERKDFPAGYFEIYNGSDLLAVGVRSLLTGECVLFGLDVEEYFARKEQEVSEVSDKLSRLLGGE